MELAELEPDAVGEAAVDLLRAIARLLSSLARDSAIWNGDTMRDLLVSAVHLRTELVSNGYAEERLC